MSYFDDASLVMIPSGYKDQKVYSVKPIDGTGDLVFSRGSDIEATRVAANGYIQKAAVNLLLQSNSFSTTWVNSNTTETGGQADKDGGTTAWKIDKSAASGYIQQVISQSEVQTFSVYAKKGTLNWMRMIGVGTNTASTWFDLENGVVGAADFFTIDSNIEDAGNGFYRCSITYSQGTVGGVRIYPADGNNDVSGTSGNIYIQDAQLNYGLVAQEYQETTTTSVVAGITNDMPRLDYSGGATCPSLKLEPSRTNLVISSEDIDSVWAKLRVSVENNNTTSPEGFVNAGKSTATAVSGTHASYDTFSGSVTAGNDYFISCFVKKATTKYIKLNEGYTGAYVTFNFDDQTTDLQSGASNVLLEEYANGWYRLGFKFTADSSGNAQFALYINDDNNNTNYIGSGEAVYLWGAQIEAGSYPTSYIPTYGTSATRTQDNSVTASPSTSSFGQTEGTIFTEIEINAITSGAYSRVLNLKNSGGSNQIYIQQNDSRINGVVFKGSNQFSASTSSGFLSVGSTYKIALAYKDSDYALYINGSQIATGSASGLGTLSVDRLDFTTGAGNINLGNKVKQSLVFNTRLSNSDLAALTA